MKYFVRTATVFPIVCLAGFSQAGSQHGKSAWVTIHNAQDGITVKVPPGWFGINPNTKQIEGFIEKAHDQNSNMGISKDAAAEVTKNKLLKLFVFAKSDPTTHFAPNMNLIVLPGYGDIPLAKTVPEMREQFKKFEREVAPPKHVHVAGVPAVVLETKIETKNMGTLHDLVYLLTKGGKFYEMTFSIPEHLFVSMRPDAERIAASLRL
jgi:hypothetical protein